MKNDPKQPNLPCIRCREKEARDGGAMCWDCTHAGTVNAPRVKMHLEEAPNGSINETDRDERWTSIGYCKYRNTRGMSNA